MAAKGGARGTKAKGGKEWGGKARKRETRKGKGARKAAAIAEAGAVWGNARIAKAEFMLERRRETGCLAIEAARAWEGGAR